MVEAIVGLIMGGLFIVWNIAIGILSYKLMFKYPDKAVFCFAFFFFAPIGFIVSLAYAGVKEKKDRDNIYGVLIKKHNNENVDKLIAYIEKYKCADNPNAWHQLRGVWHACNQSSNITTNKKQELQSFLMLKGLYLNNEERKIISNYVK